MLRTLPPLALLKLAQLYDQHESIGKTCGNGAIIQCVNESPKIRCNAAQLAILYYFIFFPLSIKKKEECGKREQNILINISASRLCRKTNLTVLA